jgi:UDP:flavonoid glycosyltransferase YjiC (YdhE family)
VLHGFSPLVVSRPHDWRSGLDVVGYRRPYDRYSQLPVELRVFLDAGPPPVFVGLGSATVPDPARVSTDIVRALRRAGLRGVIQRGWAGLTATGDDMLTIDEVPHSALFPHMAAVVHHAGAGTTAAGLRAGVPTVAVPVLVDQPFWADRLHRLGVAPAPVPLQELTADTLTNALRSCLDRAAYRQQAAALARQVAADDGAGAVLSLITQVS